MLIPLSKSEGLATKSQATAVLVLVIWRLSIYSVQSERLALGGWIHPWGIDTLKKKVTLKSYNKQAK